MPIKLNAATGGGSVSLSAPNSTTSNADVTLTLPPNDGDASQYLQTDGAGALSWATVTSPKILQVVTGTTATQVSHTTTTFTDTGLSATITPASTSNKVLVMVSQAYRVSKNANSAQGAINLVRGSTEIFSPAFSQVGLFANGASSTNVSGWYTFNIMDSPATTSATTYKTQGRIFSSEIAIYSNLGDVTSTIVLMEVEG